MTDFSLDLLVETLPSKVTQKNYKYILNKFLEFGKFSSYDNIIETDVKKLDKIIKAYIISLKSTMNPNSIPSYADAIKSFLEANNIDLNWRRIRKLYPRPAKKTGQSTYSTDDIQLMLKHTAKIRNKVFIHFLASTAVRVSALDELKMKDLRDMPHGCKMVTVMHIISSWSLDKIIYCIFCSFLIKFKQFNKKEIGVYTVMSAIFDAEIAERECPGCKRMTKSMFCPKCNKCEFCHKIMEGKLECQN